MPNTPEQDPRIYFAAERTFLAWIRTGIALMGFGFALARFGLFLRDMPDASHGNIILASTPISGVGLLTIGIIVNLVSSLQYARTIRQLRDGSWIPGRLSVSGIALALVLALFGIVMAAHLLSLR